jgi:hypothetical protein
VKTPRWLVGPHDFDVLTSALGVRELVEVRDIGV